MLFLNLSRVTFFIKRLDADKAIIEVKTADAVNRLISNSLIRTAFELSFHPLKSSTPELSRVLVSLSRWIVSEKI